MKEARTFSELDDLTKAFQSRLGDGLVAIVLFGSRARGEETGQSDWDLFVLAENLPEYPFDRQLLFRETIPRGFPHQVSVLPKTREEFEKEFLSIYLDMATDGVILFDRDHYIEKKLEKIRDIIKEAGLKRTKEMGHLIWRWKSGPRVGWKIDWNGIDGFDRRSKIQIKTERRLS